MAVNFPGPYELRLTYTALVATQPLKHSQRLNLALVDDPNPGADFSNIQAVTRGGLSTPDLAAAVEAWLTLIRIRFADETSIGVVELWKYEDLTFEAQFISAYNPTISQGTSVDDTVKSNQEIFTFRTIEGGIMRINLMETVAPLGQIDPYPTPASGADEIFEFVIDTDNWILARDTSYPFAALNWLPGQNEKSFRQRFR